MNFNFNDYKSYLQPLTEEFIEQNSDKVNWSNVSVRQTLSEEFIERNSDKVDWCHISAFQKLSEGFIERNADKVNWDNISSRQKLSEDFIERNSDKVNWNSISVFQKLSEGFIESNSDKVNWSNISACQKLSEGFIEQNSDKVDWEWVSMYQILSEEFRAKHNLEFPTNSWMYVDKDIKLKAIQKTGLFQIESDYVIAYKGIRSDNYSAYNFQYKYELGGVYEAHADYNLDRDYSFGLSAWTEEEARKYCSQKLIKVRIHLDDVAGLAHNGGKIRCTRLEVIEEL